MSSAAPSPALRAPLQQSSQSAVSRLISRPATPADSNGRRPLTAPNSPRLGGGAAGGLGGAGVRRKSASGARGREADPSIALQKALSSDEFVRKREGGKKRGAEGAGSENTQLVLRSGSSASTSSAVAMSRSRSSSSATSSTASGSTLQPRHVTPHPRASRSHSSLSSRQRSRSRSRTSRGSPILGAASLPTLPPPTNRSVSSSSCPEPRGATLSVTPTTSEPVMVDVQAEGELELRGRAGGNAAEVLVELRDGRSVPNSEYGDDDRDSETFAEIDSTLIQDDTLPLSLPDLPPTEAISHSHSLPPLHSSPHSHSHSRRPSASRNRTSPSAIPSPTEGINKLASKNGRRRSSHADSAMSTSPLAASPDQLLPISAPRPPASPCTRPRAPTTTSQQRGRSPTTSSSSEHQRTPSQSSRSLVVEKRRRRESVESTVAVGAGGEATTPEHIRPPLHTYTSFETAFGVEAPRSPEGSPTKTESKGWWGRS